MPEGRNAGSLQSLVESLGTASLFQHLDRCHIQGIGQRKAQSHRAIETVIVIVWTIKSGLGCEVGRDVGYAWSWRAITRSIHRFNDKSTVVCTMPPSDGDVTPRSNST